MNFCKFFFKTSKELSTFAIIFALTALFSATFFSCSSYDSTFDFSSLSAECGTSVSLYNDDPYIIAEPTSEVVDSPKAGFIFYPGGLVSYQAYLPLMIKCAKSGICCFIIKMPSDFAILNMNAAYRVQKRYPQITNWYIGGHSLGGAMSASYVASHTQDFAGLILLAAYSTSDISDSSLKVLSVYGTNDGVLNMENYAKYKTNLPNATSTNPNSNGGYLTEIVIEGGNHAQYASYGAQSGDGEATITEEEQQTITANAIVNLISVFVEK